MKRAPRLVSVLILCLALFTYLCPNVYANAPTTPDDIELSVSTENTTAVFGTEIKITVTAKNKSASYALDYLLFTLKYDRSTLSYVSNSVSAGADHTGFMVIADPNGMVVRYIADDSTDRKVIAAGGEMKMEFKFTSLVSSVSSTAITFSDIKAYTRSNLSSTSIVGDNLLHTFTISEPYSSLNLSVRTLSNDSTLSSLSVKVDNVEKALSPAFTPTVTSYTFSATEPIGAVIITCACTNQAAKYQQSQSGSVYTITVTAEDGSTKTYTLTLNSVTTTTATTTTTTTTTTTATPETTTTIPEFTAPTTVYVPVVGGTVSDSTVSDSDAGRGSGLLTTINISILGLIGLVAAEIGLFMLAFLSGYMTHKNAAKPPKISLEDLVAAQAQAELDGYDDRSAEPAEIEDPALSQSFISGFSAQANFPIDNLGMQPGFDMGAGMAPGMGMDGMGMQPGFDMNAGMAPGMGMDGMGMQPGFDMGAGMAPGMGMDGMGMQPGFDMGAGMAPGMGMDGMGMQPGFDMNAGMAPGMGMDGMGMQPGFDMGAGMAPGMGMDGMGMQPGFDMNAGMAPGMGMDGMGMQPGFDMNGMGMPPGNGYGM